MFEPKKQVGPKINPVSLREIQLAIRTAGRGDYSPALAILRSYYARPTEKLPPEGLSYYGLCMAKVEGRYRDAIEICKQSLERNAHHGNSFVNLARVYMMAGNRRKAVETLEQGLAEFPGHPALLSFRDEIGYRRPPVIPFLSRDNALNVALGKKFKKNR